MKIPIFYFDAFTNTQFKGNPIAVCLLEEEIDNNIMQDIATEIGFSETAFIYSQNAEFIHTDSFKLKWFTPSKEVKLCGHGTLGASSLILEQLNNKNKKIYFNTLSGQLSVEKINDYIMMDFPLRTFIDYNPDKSILNALNISEYKSCIFSKHAETLLFEIDNVLSIKPDFEKLKSIDNIGAVIITQKSNDKYDFRSRYFTPWYGVNEDPVTGSAHSLLANYWYKQTNKKEFFAYQASKRSGELKILLNDNNPDRVFIGGQCVLVLKGELYL